MWRASRWRCHSCCADVVTLIALGLCHPLPCALHWRLSPDAGVIVLVALASSHWRCCVHHNVIAALASLPALRWRPCKHCAGIVTIVLLTSLSLLRWVFALPLATPISITLASLSSSWWHYPSCADVCLIATCGDSNERGVADLVVQVVIVVPVIVLLMGEVILGPSGLFKLVGLLSARFVGLS